MNWIITGAAGFVGSNLVNSLLKDPRNNVIGVDNFVTGKRAFLQAAISNPKFKLIDFDLCSELRVQDFPSNFEFETAVVVHLAANSDIYAANLNPSIDFKLGTLVMNNVLEFMRKVKCSKIIFASGSGVYGESQGKPFIESDLTSYVTSTYGASKLSCEALLAAYSSMFGLKVFVLRFCNLVGPNATHGVIHDLIRKALKDLKGIQVLGNGTQEKPYMHVDDAIGAIVLFSQLQGDGFQVFNVGNSTTKSVSQICEKLSELIESEIGESPSFIFGYEDRGWNGDVPKYELNLEKISSIGFRPSLETELAINKAIPQIFFQVQISKENEY